MSYLSPAEVTAIQHLSRKTPYLIGEVSMGMFSLARLYGGIKYNGDVYKYVPETDELVRLDVMRYVQSMRRREAKETDRKAAAAREAAQASLLD